jgi:hypothetical protein
MQLFLERLSFMLAESHFLRKESASFTLTLSMIPFKGPLPQPRLQLCFRRRQSRCSSGLSLGVKRNRLGQVTRLVVYRPDEVDSVRSSSGTALASLTTAAESLEVSAPPESEGSDCSSLSFMGGLVGVE